MAGLLQITNLALPLTSPFSEATTGYSVDGQRVNFDRIDLKSSEMTMSGSGELDFDKRTVNLWLVTDNATLVALPVVGPLLHSAKEELLKIHVKGTIEEPKVSIRSSRVMSRSRHRPFPRALRPLSCPPRSQPTCSNPSRFAP
jgi:hypothetical protein